MPVPHQIEHKTARSILNISTISIALSIVYCFVELIRFDVQLMCVCYHFFTILENDCLEKETTLKSVMNMIDLSQSEITGKN